MEENLASSMSDEDIRHIKTQYNKAKDVLEKVGSLSQRYDATTTLLKGREEEIERISNDAREKLNTIDNARNESAGLVATLKSNLEKVQTDISSMEEGLLRFENVRGKIEASNGEIDNLVSTANNLKQDIENVKVSALQKLADIDSVLSQVQERIAKMQEAYQSFLVLNEKISDENTGLQAILNQVIELQKKSKQVSQEISTFRDEAKANLAQIRKTKEESDALKKAIEDNLASTLSSKEQVEKITDLITDTGFANAFQKRERKLFYGSIFWLGVFLLSVAALAIELYKLFGLSGAIPAPEVLLYRLTLTAPLLILIGFSISQYRNDRNLTERYAFKAVIAEVIRNHTKFLSDTANDSNPQTALFAKQTIENVYKEPYVKEEQGKKKQKKLNIQEMVEGVKELKDLVPDDASLQSIIKLLTQLR